MSSKNEREPSPESVDFLRSQLELYKLLNVRVDWFFLQALGAYYSPDESGLPDDVGHVIYRLSESFPKKERERIRIYRDDDGKILFESTFWLSLEDWRKEWEKFHLEIPFFQSQLMDVESVFEEE